MHMKNEETPKGLQYFFCHVKFLPVVVFSCKNTFKKVFQDFSYYIND